MKAHLLLAVWLVLPWGALADPVKVSADEFGGYTRLILEFEDRPQWDIRRRGVGYRMRFERMQPLNFDLSDVFRAIGRDRVADIRAIGNNALEIDVACRCQARVSAIGESALLIDVMTLVDDQPRAKDDIADMPLPPGEEASPVRPTAEIAVPGAPDRLPIPQLLDGGYSEPARPVLPDARLGLLPSGRVQPQGLAVELVARALSRAAAQGLVTANDEIDERIGLDPQLSIETNERGNLSVTTSFDRAIPSDALPSLPSPQGAVCLPDEAVDVAAWGDTDDRRMLGRLRRDAIAEDGSLKTSGAKALSRYYLHMGFGAEARAAARFLPGANERGIVEALADIMDRGMTDSGVFDGQVTCSGAVSLWATLAGPLSLSSVPETTNPLLSTFSALPTHLRTHLGPLLSKRLHEAGFEADARMAINAVTRIGTHTEESELASARLELDGTQSERARASLAELATGTNATAAAALLELLEDAEARGMPPNPIWVEEAPTLVGVLEGKEIAKELDFARMKALIALGRFDQFRNAITENTPGLTPDSRVELSMLALGAAARAASDTDFLTSELSLSRLVNPGLMERPLRIAVADRLDSLGLASRADQYLGWVPETVEDLSVAVRVLSGAGRHNEALELLRESEIGNAAALAAETLRAAGQDRAAMDAFLSAEKPEEAVEIAIRQGDWSWIAEHGANAFADAARGLQEPISVSNATDDGPNAALINATRDRRARLQALLRLTQPGTDRAAFTN